MDQRRSFAADLVALGAPTQRVPAALFDDVYSRYGEPHRRYHGVAHVEHVVDTVAALGGGPIERLAAWFHDAIYDVRASDNEQRSAELAVRLLSEAGVDPASTHRISELVLATAHGQGTCEGDDVDIVLDADLSVLAAPADVYAHYVDGVRFEYSHVDDDEWRVGRARVLQHFLDQPRIFRTEAGRTWEASARANLLGELAALGAR